MPSLWGFGISQESEGKVAFTQFMTILFCGDDIIVGNIQENKVNADEKTSRDKHTLSGSYFVHLHLHTNLQVTRKYYMTFSAKQVLFFVDPIHISIKSVHLNKKQHGINLWAIKLQTKTFALETVKIGRNFVTRS